MFLAPPRKLLPPHPDALSAAVLAVFRRPFSVGPHPPPCRLYDAAAEGNVQQVRRLIELGVPVDCVSRVSIFGGRRAPTALLVAVQHDRVETVVELMAYGADVSRRFSNGQSALAYCCQHGNEETARRVLRHGEWRAQDFQAAWTTARAYGRSDMERLLEAARWRRCAELVARQRLALASAMHSRLGAGCLLDRCVSGWPGTGDLHQMVARRLPCASVSYGFIVDSTVEWYWPIVLRRERLLDEAELLALATEADCGDTEAASADERTVLLASGAARRAALACIDAGFSEVVGDSTSIGPSAGCETLLHRKRSSRREELQTQITITPSKELLSLLTKVLSEDEVEAVKRAMRFQSERQRHLREHEARRECDDEVSPMHGRAGQRPRIDFGGPVVRMFA
jgi:hypothetical protein